MIPQLEIFKSECDRNLIGKHEQFNLVLANFLAGGNTLIEDVPGVGKTTLVKVFSQVFNFNLSRIQFTNDLLPSDILGTSIYIQSTNKFEFHKGPIFGDIIMADELNRAPPKTQSALLQAMEERAITIDGRTYELPEHFHIIATQNPHSQVGTYDLPESQVDRFSLKISLGHADKTSTLRMLQSKTLNSDIVIKQTIEHDWVVKTKNLINDIIVSDSIYEYVYRLLEYSRMNCDFPLSNRAGIDLIKIAKAYAYLRSDNAVLSNDIKYLFPFVAGHRLVTPSDSDINLEKKHATKILQDVPIRDL